MSGTLLDPITMPLDGIRLIEASAGTGKTWTIAALYLRLVLGQGEPMRRPLLPPEILVLTFTKAATAELRERIRSRLAEAAAVFRTESPPADAFLERLLASYPDIDQRASAARRLEQAGHWMDEAAIHTIHAWSQRTLQRHAFHGGQALTQDTQADEGLLQAEAVRDYWRAQCFPLDRYAAARIRACWKTPADLQRNMRAVLSATPESLRLAGLPLPAMGDLGERIEHALRPEQEALSNAQRLVTTQIDAIETQIRDTLQRGGFNVRMMKPEAVENDLLVLRCWTQGGPIDETTLDRYTQTRLLSATKKGFDAPRLDAFQAIEAWQSAREHAPPICPLVLAHAVPWIQRRLQTIKQQRAQIGFDDMLLRLDHALHGDHGETLADALADAYPVALIDEFQDTDPLQWRIFERIYAGRPDRGLLLIGDPKQAIYSFRGADIHTYLLARNAATPPAWTLGTNHRSTHAMVGAVNRLFAHGQTHDDGAFGFGERLSFAPVAARGRTDRLVYDGRPLSALIFALQPCEQPLGLQAYRDAMAHHAAATLVDWLDAARQGRCGFVTDEGTMAPLCQGDIAILVRNRSEAALVREALRQRGLKSVYLSDRDSVFETPQAADLLRWLQACADPGSDRAMRAALATPSMCRSYAELDRLNSDEQAWEQTGDVIRTLHQTWQRHGVLAMVHNLLHNFALPRRLLALSDGERALTNLLQLAELLQHAAASLDGERALIRYLAARMAEASDGQIQASDEQIVRLESEDALIKVITIHKSKGLEYPVVLLPFAAAARSAGPGDVVTWHDDAGVAVTELAADGSTRAAAAREQWQEDLRLLYVAMTRARYLTWVGIACYRIGNTKASALHRSALGHLLSGGESIEPADLRRRLTVLQEGHDDIGIVTLDDQPAQARYRADDAGTHVARHALGYTVAAPALWRIASYSGLKYEDPAIEPPAPETALQATRHELLASNMPANDQEVASEGIHAFKRGATAGTFLHEILEWAAEQGFAQAISDRQTLLARVTDRATRHDWQRYADMLTDWIIALLSTPLPLPSDGRISLAALSSSNYYAELEFWIEAHAVNTQTLDRLVQRYTLDAAPRLPLAHDQLNGMLKGFIDLIIEHQGRYYIVDYKSNYLGRDAAAYTLAAMRQSVLDERYDLQYALYTLALHRQLRARLPGYDYERHIGGVMYLYLRGIDAQSGGVHRERLPYALVDAMDRLFAEGIDHAA